MPSYQMAIDDLRAAFARYIDDHGPDNLRVLLERKVEDLRKHRVTSHALKKTADAQPGWRDPLNAPFNVPVIVMTVAYRGDDGFYTRRGTQIAVSGWAPAPPKPVAATVPPQKNARVFQEAVETAAYDRGRKSAAMGDIRILPDELNHVSRTAEAAAYLAGYDDENKGISA